MPQNGLNYGGRRRGARGDTCKADSHVPGAALVNGAVVHNGCPAAATRIRGSAPAGSPNGTKAQCMVNGYINNGYKGKSRKAPLPRTPRKQGSMISAVTDASAAARVSSAFPGGISVNGPTSPGTTSTAAAAALPCNSDQMAPEPSPSAPAKNQRRWKRIRHEKRPVCTLLPPPPVMPPQVEDWESEIQEVTLTDWEKESFGIRPYGPEDVIHFSLRCLTLNKQRDTPNLPVTANYRPAVHHRRPLRWSCYSIPTEPGQFADADDAAAGAQLQAALSMVSPTMKALVDAVWAVWSIGASIYDYIHTSAMEERIHTLEDVVTIHQCVIGLLSAGVVVLLTYIVFKKL
ncbi:hypothetical protein GBF38_003568 [Nibea albiflora]|uniref:Uncharacterized protein n=1 Tax=Nibea albiflora TaxID=240163 RepID=A0ACB7FLF5_NIBAL|nr:hypothetical protein GBF38_003568 [Nibea albiflora]